MDYEKLKEVIAKQIKENGREEITGPVLQMVLMAMVDSLGEVYPQTYTDEQKAQARANIDALSDYDGEITKEKLSLEVQAILNDVANKQNITDESLATIAKTIVGAINEVYNGGLKDASIATSNIEDGAVTEGKLASSSVTNEKIADNAVTNEKVNGGAITEPKLDTTLQAKVNNNVKTVEQVLTPNEIAIVSKNLKFRDDNGNFFADKASYDAVAKLSVKPSFSVFGVKCTNTTFGNNNSYNTFGSNCFQNTLGNDCSNNIFGSFLVGNILGEACSVNIIGTGCRYNIFGNHLINSKIDRVLYIELKSNANSTSPLKNIHILSGIQGKSYTERLVINIPDEYLNSSRELIITTKRTHGGPSNPEDIVMY